MLKAERFGFHLLSQFLARATRDVFEPLSDGELVSKLADARSTADSIHSSIPTPAPLGARFPFVVRL